MKRTRKLKVLVILSAFTFSFLPITAYADMQTVYIGYQGPLTGGESLIGAEQLEAVNYAVKKFNQYNQGKIEVKVATLDDQGDPLIASNVSSSFAKNEKIIGVVGPAYSGASIASLPNYKTAGLTVISPSATREGLTDPNSTTSFGGPVFFRVAGNYKIETKKIVETIINSRDKNIFIAADDLPFAVEQVKEITNLLKQNGITIIGSSEFKSGTNDFSPLLAKIDRESTENVLIIGFNSDTAVLMKQLNVIYSKNVTLGGDPDLNLLSSLTGALSFRNVQAISSRSYLKKLLPVINNDYIAVAGKNPGDETIRTIDATNIFLSCISSGYLSRLDMRKCVYNYKGRNLFGDEFSFSLGGDLINSAHYPHLTIDATNWKNEPVMPLRPSSANVLSYFSWAINESTNPIIQKPQISLINRSQSQIDLKLSLSNVITCTPSSSMGAINKNLSFEGGYSISGLQPSSKVVVNVECKAGNASQVFTETFETLPPNPLPPTLLGSSAEFTSIKVSFGKFRADYKYEFASTLGEVYEYVDSAGGISEVDETILVISNLQPGMKTSLQIRVVDHYGQLSPTQSWEFSTPLPPLPTRPKLTLISKKSNQFIYKVKVNEDVNVKVLANKCTVKLASGLLIVNKLNPRIACKITFYQTDSFGRTAKSSITQ